LIYVIIAILKNTLAILFQLKESMVHAMQGLSQNKLRAMLSTLGITIGIFCIIMVLTMVDSLERNIQNSVDALGKDVLFVEKWPWEFSDNYKWWKYMNRPTPKLIELNQIKQRSELTDAAAMVIKVYGITLKYGNQAASNVVANGVSHEYERIKKLEFLSGRYFTEGDSRSGNHVVVIGYGIADNLFGNQQAVGKQVTIRGTKFNVIGVLEREGESLLGNSMDNTILIPLTTASRYVRLNSDYSNGQLQIKPKEGITVDMLEEEINVIMRNLRRLKPGQEQNFALNKTTLIAEPLKRIFGIVNLAGWVIGMFSMLVGGFGISNIMFVSVKERTAQIGIKKALGARSYVILVEFLFEAVMLCLAGGGIGMLMVAGCAMIAENVFDFSIYMSASIILTGVIVSVSIGVISGFLPARTAAALDPVEAMRAK
jgi:putative ABC transport system permease protein